MAATFRLIVVAWPQLLLVLGLYRVGFLVVEFIGRMAWFVSEICLLPAQLVRLHVPAVESMRNMIVSGVSLATVVGWLAQVVSYWASSVLDLLLCTALMLVVLRTDTARCRPP